MNVLNSKSISITQLKAVQVLICYKKYQEMDTCQESSNIMTRYRVLWQFSFVLDFYFPKIILFSKLYWLRISNFNCMHWVWYTLHRFKDCKKYTPPR